MSRVVLVTGASEGIGAAIAERFVADGDAVVITGRREDPLAATAQRLGCQYEVGDIADAAARDVAISRCLQAGGLDVLVNNAAFVPQPGPLTGYDEVTAVRAWTTNVLGPLLLTRAALDAGMRERGGVVVNIGSLGGTALQPDMGLYAITKAALHHATRQLAAELGPAVRVNAVVPGLIRTEGSRFGWQDREEAIARRAPAGRLGESEDVAEAVHFLAAQGASWITGECLVVDGGASVQLGRRSRT